MNTTTLKTKRLTSRAKPRTYLGLLAIALLLATACVASILPAFPASAANADTVTTWNASTKTLSLIKDATGEEINADVLNHIDEMETFDFGQGHAVTGFCYGVFHNRAEDISNDVLKAIKGVPVFPEYEDETRDYFSSMFYKCSALQDITALGEWKLPLYYDPSAPELAGSTNFFTSAFFDCASLSNVSALENLASKYKALSCTTMFMGCDSLQSVTSLANLDTENCISFESTFTNCNNLEILDISNWTKGKPTMEGDSGASTDLMFASINFEAESPEITSLPNLHQITMGNDFLPSEPKSDEPMSGSYFPYQDEWIAYYNGEPQATLHGHDEFAAYQKQAQAKGWGASTYYKKGYEPAPEPTPEPSLSDGWVQDDRGWRYVLDGEYLNDGWHYFEDEYGNHWYYFDTDTYIATSRWIWDDNWQGWYWLCSTGPMIENLWQWIDNAWYGFWWGGKMCQGWVWDTYYQAWYYCDDYTGRVACNEWAWDGAWYYFDQNCQMVTNTWIDGCWLDSHGMWVY